MGKIKTGSYESRQSGQRVYYTEVVASSVGFGETKAEAEARLAAGQQLTETGNGFMTFPDGLENDLPFN